MATSAPASSSNPSSPVTPTNLEFQLAQLLSTVTFDATTSSQQEYSVNPAPLNDSVKRLHTEELASVSVETPNKMNTATEGQVTSSTSSHRKGRPPKLFIPNSTQKKEALKSPVPNPLFDIKVPSGLPQGVDKQIWRLAEIADVELPQGKQCIIVMDLDDVLIQKNIDSSAAEFQLVEDDLPQQLASLKETFSQAPFFILTRTEPDKISIKFERLASRFPEDEFKEIKGIARYTINPDKGNQLLALLNEHKLTDNGYQIIFIDDNSDNLTDVKKVFEDNVTTLQYMGGIDHIIACLKLEHNCKDENQLWEKAVDEAGVNQLVLPHLRTPYRQHKELEQAILSRQ
ncbi:MAG: DUF2608 domain-containing protein [Parashewanella sp.]